MRATQTQEKNKGGRPRMGAEVKIKRGYSSPPDMVRDLDTIAAARGVSASVLVAEAIGEMLKRAKAA